MEENFQPEEFVTKLLSGKFDRQLSERVSELTDEQLHQIALILGQRGGSHRGL